MREVNARLGEDIQLGRMGENLATCVTFDVSEWLNAGEGTVHLLHQRNGDELPYPCAITVENGVATWAITASDVAVAGRGRAELQYLDGEVCIKSEVYTTSTLRSLGKASEVPPAPAENWLRKVLKAAGNAFESAKAALTSEKAAKASETNAKASETNAKASETAAKASEVDAETAAKSAANSSKAALTSENNAKTSEDAAKAAQKGAEKARDTAVAVVGGDFATRVELTDAEQRANEYTDEMISGVTPKSIYAMATSLGYISATDLFAWAEEQTVGGTFVTNPGYTTQNVPAAGRRWYGTLFTAGFNYVIFLTSVSTGNDDDGDTYVTAKTSDGWRPWRRLATTDYTLAHVNSLTEALSQKLPVGTTSADIGAMAAIADYEGDIDTGTATSFLMSVNANTYPELYSALREYSGWTYIIQGAFYKKIGADRRRFQLAMTENGRMALRAYNGSVWSGWTGQATIGWAAANQDHKWKSYTKPEDIGLVTGQETIEEIVGALATYNKLAYAITSAHNTSIYPYANGTIEFKKWGSASVTMKFYPVKNSSVGLLERRAYLSGGAWVIGDWKELATTDYALPRDGSKAMTKHLNITDPSITEGSASVGASTNFSWLRSSPKYGDGLNYRQINLYGKDTTYLDCLRLFVVENGTAADTYTILHTGNKPSGSYTGNGDATSRTIEVGGIGSTLRINGGNCMAIVTGSGAICKDANNNVVCLSGEQCSFNGTTLTMATDSICVNRSGTTHYYEVL